jgi:predicted Fe-Mo cluster-binding NifX family protein
VLEGRSDMDKIRVCIGSNDTSTIAASHMGDAQYFCVYDVFADGEEPVLVEERPNTTGEGTRHADREKMRGVLDIVGDADVLLARRKSPNFRAIARTTAYQPVVVSTDAIGDALRLVKERFAEINTYVARRAEGERSEEIPVLFPAADRP